MPTGLSVAAIARKLNDENVPTHAEDAGIPPASSGRLLGSCVKNARDAEERASGESLAMRRRDAGDAALGASRKVGSGFVMPAGTLSGHWPLVVGRSVFLRW